MLIGWAAFAMLRLNGLNALKLGIFVLFVILLVPIAISFWTAAIGFVVQLRGGDPLALTRAQESGQPRHGALPRTAVVMPAYNEEPARVFAGLAATYQSLQTTGLLAGFDFFILSDTNNPDIWVREEVAFAELRGLGQRPGTIALPQPPREPRAQDREIADFCATWGERYRYMIVLDADSIMTGSSLMELVRLMETQSPGGHHPNCRRCRSTGARYSAACSSSPRRPTVSIFITGLNFWQGGAGNYWGHNAIIRIRPFVEHCRLADAPGQGADRGPNPQP